MDYEVDDSVRFVAKGGPVHGTIARLNAKTAHVVTDDGEEYRVPYALLELVGRTATSDTPRRGADELDAIAQLAQQLLARHGLSQWRFEFDNARMRAGSCRFESRLITMSVEFARRAPEAEIRDTILHEIAHALVGPQHGHGPAWQAKAREIGCSARRCHDTAFTTPRYIVQCENSCFLATSNRRRRNVICRQCHGSISYQTYTGSRWQMLHAETERD